MIACIDVGYQDTRANVACIVFENWNSTEPFSSHKILLDNIEPYTPGEFYKRELPCVLKILDEVKEPLEVIVLDSYVWLDDQKSPGLGRYLYENLVRKVPVIGVAKNKFEKAEKYTEEVFRGESTKPLYVSAVGIELEKAKEHISNMYGEFRIPHILKLVDQLSRDWS